MKSPLPSTQQIPPLPSLILLKKDGQVNYLNTGGIVLGFMEAQFYKQEEVNFEPGDIFIAYTDGVTETMDLNEAEFGEERIINIVKQNKTKTVYEIKSALSEALSAFSNNTLNADDLTIIIAKHD